MAQSELDKTQALNGQKIMFLERENQQASQRVAQLQNENSKLLDKLQEKLQEKPVEPVAPQEEKVPEEKHKAIIEKLKVKYEEMLKDLVSKNEKKFKEKESIWRGEKEKMNQQVEIYVQRLDENRKMSQQLMAMVNEKKAESSTPQPKVDESEMKQLQETNKTLSQTIAAQEERFNELNTKIAKLKVYSKIFKHSMSS